MNGPAIRRDLVKKPVRLAAVAAFPVFYQSPLYRMVAADPRVDLTVIFASSAGVRPHAAGFGEREVVWDVDMLSDYRHEFLEGADTNDVAGGFFALRGRDAFGRVRRGSFDAVWVHGYSYLSLCMAIAGAAAARTPVLVREEQTLLHPRPQPKRWIRAAILRVLFARARGLYIGTRNREFFERFGVRDDHLFFTPYCVDNDEFQRRARELKPKRADLRRRLGLPPDPVPVIAFVGKLTDKKQPLVLLDAYARVRRELPCALLFVGDGDLAAQVRARVAELAVPDVCFAGFLNRSEIAEAYAVADTFVLPSAYHETWGLVVNEAMNFSLPIVVSDKVGCALDLVREGENGHIVPAGDVAALAAALRGLVADSARREAYGRRSFELISSWHYAVAAEGIVTAAIDAARGQNPGG